MRHVVVLGLLGLGLTGCLEGSKCSTTDTDTGADQEGRHYVDLCGTRLVFDDDEDAIFVDRVARSTSRWDDIGLRTGETAVRVGFGGFDAGQPSAVLPKDTSWSPRHIIVTGIEQGQRLVFCMDAGGPQTAVEMMIVYAMRENQPLPGDFQTLHACP